MQKQSSDRGLWLGLLGVTIFSITLPMTRLAVGDQTDPQLPPLFVTAGRACCAAILSAIYLLATRAPMPPRRLYGDLLLAALGVVIGYPLFLGFALRQVDSTHAAVVTGLLPIGTAAFAALMLKQRPSIGFWLAALLGCALVVAFAALRGGGHLKPADGLLLLAIVSTSFGYVAGARAAAQMRAEHVISWSLIVAMPITLPVAVLAWPAHGVTASAWTGFGYVAIFSSWLGFFAWYRGLALGGTMRVSQVQLLQPFFSLLFAVPILGEQLDAVTIVFAVAVIATVAISKRMPTHTGAIDN
ncbi:DMT family transporter [soil metagenome]